MLIGCGCGLGAGNLAGLGWGLGGEGSGSGRCGSGCSSAMGNFGGGNGAVGEGGDGGRHGSGCGPAMSNFIVAGGNGVVGKASASLSSSSSLMHFLRALALHTSRASGNGQFSPVHSLEVGITCTNDLFHKACEQLQGLVHIIRV